MVKHDRPALRRKYLKLLKMLAALAIPGTVICLSGPLYVGVLFGAEEWSEAGVILAALTPYLMGSFVFKITSFYYERFEVQISWWEMDFAVGFEFLWL